MSLSVIVVTAGRETLSRSLESIAAQGLLEGDEVLVVGNGAAIQAQAESWGFRYVEDGPFGCWGQRERQAAMKHATGSHLLFLDDDDFYVAGAFEVVRRAIESDRASPFMFRMLAQHVPLLWTEPVLRCGNVSGLQFVTPNVPGKLGAWGLRYEGDYDFIVSTMALYPAGEAALKWRAEVIVGCRHNGVPARLERLTRHDRIVLVLEGWLRVSPEVMAISKAELAARFERKHPGEPSPTNGELVAAIMAVYDADGIDFPGVGALS